MKHIGIVFLDKNKQLIKAAYFVNDLVCVYEVSDPDALFAFPA